MELIPNNALRMMERSMEFLWTKQTCILDNLANAETPGYKTRYVTFEEALDSALRSANSGKEIREALSEIRPELHEAEETGRLDGNGVNLTEQSVELARNGYQLQYAMDAIADDLSLLRTAIRG